mgnify:CR=1 FL=1
MPFLLDLMKKLWNQDVTSIYDEIDNVREMGKESLADVRRIMFDLKPSLLHQDSFSSTLTDFFNDYEAKYNRDDTRYLCPCGLSEAKEMEIRRGALEAFRIIGGEYASVQLGPDAFKRLCVKYDRALVDVMHKYGAVAHYHNHGPVMRYLEDFAAIGIDCIDPMEAPPWGDCDLREARRRLGDRLCFLGNLDDMEIIDKLPTEEVLAIARKRLDEAGDRGFILGGTSSGAYGEHGARNFIAMAEMVAGS